MSKITKWQHWDIAIPIAELLFWDGIGRSSLLLNVMNPWTRYFVKASRHLDDFLPLPLCNTFYTLMWWVLRVARASSTDKDALGIDHRVARGKAYVQTRMKPKNQKSKGACVLLQVFPFWFFCPFFILTFLLVCLFVCLTQTTLCYFLNWNFKIDFTLPHF